MSRLNPEKLTVEFREGVTTTEPIIPRLYTLTHSDTTAELFLVIGNEFAYDNITPSRDEVLGEWVNQDEIYYYYVYLQVDGTVDNSEVFRNIVFRRELPLALEAIRYGDREFFEAHSDLDRAPIIVFFQSENPIYNKIENWGSFSDYGVDASIGAFEENANPSDVILLDAKMGDVTGDGVPDMVYLYGIKPDGPSGIFVESITIEIEDGRTKEITSITPEFNSGYNPSLFLGDFTKDSIDDIKVSIQAGGSGGYGYFYIYSFNDNNLSEIFNFNTYNEELRFIVKYSDSYKVEIGNISLDKLFIIDLSYKSYDYLAEYYDANGKLIQPVEGEVLPLSTLTPIVNNEGSNSYDLVALQRIIGTTNSDTLGYIENMISWNGLNFNSIRMFTSLLGTNLISPNSL